ncbi:MAG TPA: extracellular solute-binding protein [Stellaceae bacterium]|jgi:multiple sugar transport system substrate-binding protein|nr:extracellular solute-binding protein [Stellaceae bacterium]
MARIQRRRFLQLSGAGAVAASGGGLAGIFASGRAPAYAEGTALHWLKFVDFVPQSDVLLKGQIKDECQKALGINLTVETINGDGVQARISSAIQAKSGPDILMAVSNWAQLYGDSLTDVSDLAEARGKAEGGYFETAKDVANDGKRWIAMPFTILGVLCANRKSWFAEEGITPDKWPATWEEYRALGKKMKPKGRPFGQTLAHAFGDGPAGWYPYLWSWGGKEVEADGKTVVLNSKETVESVKFAVAMWKDAFDEGGMSWDDAGNNRAFLSNTISSTSNGASIYLLAKSKADTYMTEAGKPLKDDIFHTPLPKGPAGQFSYHVPFSNLVPNYTPNKKAALDFLKWFHSPDVYGTWFKSQQGFSVGCTKIWEDNPVWKDDPIMAPFRTAAESGHFAGRLGRAGRAAAEVISKYIIVDMYAKAVQGAPAEEAVKWAHDELVKIYV